MQNNQTISYDIDMAVHIGNVWFYDQRYEQAERAYNYAMQIATDTCCFSRHIQIYRKIIHVRHLKIWKRYIDDEFLSDSSGDQQNDMLVLQNIRNTLNFLPAVAVYKPCEDMLCAMRQRIEYRLNRQERVKLIYSVFDDQDYQEVVRLIHTVPKHVSSSHDLQVYLAKAESIHKRVILPVIERVRRAYTEYRWSEAFHELDSVRRHYPHNPTWQYLWITMSIEYGKELLEQGWKAAFEQSFDIAHHAFDQARSVFENMQDICPDYPTSSCLMTEAQGLQSIVALLQQTQTFWKRGSYAYAQEIMQQAIRQVVQSRQQSYNMMLAVIAHTRQHLQGKKPTNNKKRGLTVVR